MIPTLGLPSSEVATRDMAEAPAARLDRAAAVEALDQWLAANLCARPLGQDDVRRWKTKRFTHGWRLPEVDAGKCVQLELYIDDRYPWSPPRVCWADAMPFPSLPHVESDGLICTLPAAESFNPLQPVSVAKKVLSNAAKILEDGFQSVNENDFIEEFETYWVPTCLKPLVVSLLDPSGPSRMVCIWRGSDAILVADRKDDLVSWLRNRYGDRDSRKARTEVGALIWLHQLPPPSDYPTSVADIQAIAERGDSNGRTMLARALALRQERPLIVFGSAVNGAASFAAIELMPPPKRQKGGALAPGFRPGKEPSKLMSASRASHRVQRRAVDRADPLWVHGRDANLSLVDLLAAKIVVIGCGSLGAPVASLLARAGAGTIHLIDPQTLSWANIGRHILGSRYVRFNKALSTQVELARSFPSLSFTGHGQSWQQVAADSPALFSESDLIISTIGEWSHEAELNTWMQSKGNRSPVLYGWSEPLAAGGQAAIVGPGSGCLACGLDEFGGPQIKIATFPGETLRREAACGSWFQPYGAAQIMAVGVMVADLAVDYICGRAGIGSHRLVAAPARVIEREGGSLTSDWVARSGGRTSGGNLEEAIWAARPSCPSCSGHGFQC